MCSSADDPSMHERVTPRPPTVHEVSGTIRLAFVGAELVEAVVAQWRLEPGCPCALCVQVARIDASMKRIAETRS
jgi:hypothetical protein